MFDPVATFGIVLIHALSLPDGVAFFSSQTASLVGKAAALVGQLARARGLLLRGLRRKSGIGAVGRSVLLLWPLSVRVGFRLSDGLGNGLSFGLSFRLSLCVARSEQEECDEKG